MLDDLDVPRLEARLEALESGPEDAPARIDALLELAWAIPLVDLGRARRLTDEAARLSDRAEYPRGRAVALRNLCYMELFDGSLPQVFELARDALEALEALEAHDELATVHDTLFHAYERVGDLQAAVTSARRALDLARRAGSQRSEAWALYNLGSAQVSLGNRDEARAFLKQSQAAFRDIHPIGESRVLFRLAAICRSEGDLDGALENLEQSRQICVETGLTIGVASADCELGTLALELGDHDRARLHLDRSIEGFTEIGNRTNRAEARVRRSQLSLALGDHEAALEHLKDARADLEGLGASSVELLVYETLAQIHEAQGDLPAALEQTKRHHALYREVFDAESASELSNLRLRMDIERAQKDAEIHRLRYVELQEMQARLLRSERMASLGSLAAGLAHELNTPLGVIRSNLDTFGRVADRLADTEGLDRKGTRALTALRSGVDVSREASARIEELAVSLRRFVRLDEAAVQDADLAEGIRSALTLLASSIPEGVAVEDDLPALPRLRCRASEINQVFMTLLQNAFEAIDGEGSVRVHGAVDDEVIRIVIEDEGRGIPQAQLADLFELRFSDHGGRVRFHTGLATAAETVRAHGGEIEVQSTVGRGTRFALCFPRETGLSSIRDG